MVFSTEVKTARDYYSENVELKDHRAGPEYGGNRIQYTVGRRGNR